MKLNKIKISASVGTLSRNLRLIKSLIGVADMDRAMAVTIESLGICLDIEDAVGSSELTEKESAVKDLVVQGLSNPEIAVQVGIEEKTVKWHITSIFKKLGIKNRAALIVEHYKNALSAIEHDKRTLQEEINRLSGRDNSGRSEFSDHAVSGDRE